MVPDCFLSNFTAIASSIHLPTSDSKTLLIVGVNDIGLRSCSTDSGGLIFGIATLAFFQIVGTTPSLIDELKLKGPQKARDFAWWGQAGQTALALGCVAAGAMGQVALGIPCVVGGAVSTAALKYFAPAQ